MSTAAGWYADPSDAAWVRWWDGTAWSTEVHRAADVPRTAAPAVVPTPEPVPAVPVLEPLMVVPTLEPLAPVAVAVREPVGAGVGAGGGSSPIPTLEPLAPVTPAASVTSPVVTTVEAPPARRAEPVRTLPVAATEAPAPAVALTPGFAPDPLGTEPAHGRHPIDSPAATVGNAPWEPTAPVRPGGSGAVGGARFGGTGASAPAVRSGTAAPKPVQRTSSSRSTGRTIKRLIALAVVLALLGAGYVLLVLPRLQEKQALDTAARTPSVLPHSAPSALAGQKVMSAPGSTRAAPRPQRPRPDPRGRGPRPTARAPSAPSTSRPTCRPTTAPTPCARRTTPLPPSGSSRP